VDLMVDYQPTMIVLREQQALGSPACSSAQIQAAD
jgi:hypothetical protein